MKRYVWQHLILAFALILGWGAASATVTTTLVYSGNLDGELEPCGCSEGGDLGGIMRRATLIDRLRTEQPGLIAISSGGLLANASPRDRLKSEFILKGFASLGYDAVGVQWRDLTYGSEFLETGALPWVSSNWGRDDQFKPVRIIERPGMSWAYFSWLDPNNSPFKQMAGQHQGVVEDVAPTRQALRKARQDGYMTILATTWTLKKVQAVFDLADVDVLLIKAAYEVYGEPQQVGRTLVLQPGSRGMRLGRIDLDIEDRQITGWSHEAIPMPPEIPDAPALVGWYAEYNEQVKAAYLASVEEKKRHQEGAGPYAGSTSCQDCHGDEYEKWSRSKHAHAFERLEEVNKAFDPDCIVCHTVGFEQPGGFVDTLLTPGLMNVQCESCHGAGRAHAESGGQAGLGHAGWSRPQVCGQCHTHDHSPDFNLERYWPQIGHGRGYRSEIK